MNQQDLVAPVNDVILYFCVVKLYGYVVVSEKRKYCLLATKTYRTVPSFKAYDQYC